MVNVKYESVEVEEDSVADAAVLDWKTRVTYRRAGNLQRDGAIWVIHNTVHHQEVVLERPGVAQENVDIR